MLAALKHTFTLQLESIASKVSKIIWFHNTCILLTELYRLSRVVPDSAECANTLTPDPLPPFF